MFCAFLRLDDVVDCVDTRVLEKIREIKHDPGSWGDGIVLRGMLDESGFASLILRSGLGQIFQQNRFFCFVFGLIAFQVAILHIRFLRDYCTVL